MAKKKPAASAADPQPSPDASAPAAPAAAEAPLAPVEDPLRLVQFCLPERYAGDRRWRPALIVNGPHGEAPNVVANLSVFLDAANDLRDGKTILLAVGVVYGAVLTVASAEQGDGPGKWRVA